MIGQQEAEKAKTPSGKLKDDLDSIANWMPDFDIGDDWLVSIAAFVVIAAIFYACRGLLSLIRTS